MEAPTIFKDFHNLFTQLTYKHDPSRVFNDLLDYIIMGYLVDDSMTWNKNYSKKEIKIFFDMYAEWIQIMGKQCIGPHDWFDFFGTYWEAEILTKLGKKGMGQFFTPPTVCDLMAQLLLMGKKQPVGLLLNDPSAGSGRCLLSKHVLAPGNYHIAQDLDNTCVKMCICNFLVHGVIGEVIWQNTLTQDFYGAWRVNEGLDKIHVPHIRQISEKETLLWQSGKIKNELLTIVPEEGIVTLDNFGGESI